MPTIDEVTQARQAAQGASATAGNLISGSYSVENELKNKLNKAFGENQDIVGPLDEATQSYFSSPSEAREKYQDVFNPFSREALVSQYTGQQAIPMLSLSHLLGTRRGSIADIMNAGVGGYQAKATQASNQATQARQLYEDLRKEYESDRSYQLDLLKAAQSGQSSGLDSLSDLLPFYNAAQLNTTEQQQYGNWSEAKNSILRIENASDDTFKAAAMGGIGGQLLRLVNPDARELNQDLKNLQDILARSRSGAALNPTEEKLYREFISGDPMAVIAGYREGSGRALEILNSIADKSIKAYQPRDQAASSLFNTIFGGLGATQQTSSEPTTLFDLEVGY